MMYLIPQTLLFLFTTVLIDAYTVAHLFNDWFIELVLFLFIIKHRFKLLDLFIQVDDCLLIGSGTYFFCLGLTTDNFIGWLFFFKLIDLIFKWAD